jgi:hypothetical protein
VPTCAIFDACIACAGHAPRLTDAYIRLHACASLRYTNGNAIKLAVMFLPQDKQAVAGTIARTIAQATIHPIDTIKTRLQVWAWIEPPVAYAAILSIQAVADLLYTRHTSMYSPHTGPLQSTPSFYYTPSLAHTTQHTPHTLPEPQPAAAH